MEGHYTYSVLDTEEMKHLRTPLRIALSEIIGEPLSDDAISLGPDISIKFSHSPQTKGLPPLSPAEAPQISRAMLQRLNSAFERQFESKAAPVPTLYPLHQHLLSHELWKEGKGHILSYGFSLEHRPEAYLPVSERYVTLTLNEEGTLVGLTSEWAPVSTRNTATASPVDESDYTCYFTKPDAEGFLPPEFFQLDENLDLLIPALNYVGSAGESYLPVIDMVGLESNAATLVDYNYDDSALIRSIEEIPIPMLANILSLGVTHTLLIGSVSIRTGLVDCLEALQLASLLHLSSEAYQKNKWYSSHDFRFYLGDRNSKSTGRSQGTAKIRLEYYSLDIQIKELKGGSKQCIEFKDHRFPDNDFKICLSEKTSNAYEEEILNQQLSSKLQNEESLPPVYTEPDYLGSTNDILVLERNTEGNLVIYGYDCRSLSAAEKTQVKEKATLRFPGEDYLVIEGNELNDYIVETGLPSVDTQTSLRLGLSSAYVHSTQTYTKLAGEGLYSNRNLSKLVGEAGENTVRSRSLWLDKDLNDVPWLTRKGTLVADNHPIWDTKGGIYGKDVFVQIKTSRAAKAKSRYGTYDGGLHDIMGGLRNSRRSSLFRLIALQDFANPTLSQTEILIQAKKAGRLAINDTDLGGYKEHVDAKMRRNLGKYTDYFNALLHGEPLDIDGVRLQNVAEIEGYNSPKVREKAYTALIEKTKNYIVGNGTQTGGNQAISSFHQGLLNGHTKAQIDSMMNVAPEAGMIAQLGKPKAALHSGIKTGSAGVVFGAGFTLVTEGIYSDNIDFGRVAVSAGAQGVGEGVGTYATTRVMPYPALVTRYGLNGAIGGRVAAGGIVGAISAPVVEISTMIYDQQSGKADYESYDYSSRVGSEAVGGVVVGASAGLATAVTTAATTGTAIGTVVPVVGNVAGFVVGVVVGVGAYMVYSHFAKKPTQEFIRFEHLKALEKLHTLKGNWEVKDYGYFHVVRSRLPGGDDYAVLPTNERISIINPLDGGVNEFVKVQPEGQKARELFGNKPFDFVDARIVIPHFD